MTALDPFEHVPAGLAPALRERGFEALTTVQSKVLEPDLRGRDLRVSSQTGSGKTVAIGLVLAADLLQAAPSPPDLGARAAGRDKRGRDKRSRGSATPRCLLIAPTRELAAQLGKELTWLYAPLGTRVAVVTGGTAFGLDFRALAESPDVLIGTPGRLLDHLRRDSIDLSALKAVVLDEADQMLDMGFRDELEGILELAPTERRTHMISATFPEAVQALASRYQPHATMVQATHPREAHSDITHVAHLVKMGVRLDGLINLLLAEPDERTLVFVRTRAGTTELAASLNGAGFKGVALSGEMSQRERTATLDAFRQDQVKLLIATDVAARGLDITDVTRIVHFDVPGSPETFTHRSGRTARAGAKGTSILLVPPSARSKVELLARKAKIALEWKAVPSAEEIRQRAERRLLDSFSHLGRSESRPSPAHVALAERILAQTPACEVVAELLARTELAGPCEPRELPPPLPARREPRSEARRPGTKAGGPHRSTTQGYDAFHVTLGAKRGADPRILLAIACRRGNVRGQSIGAIQINDHSSVVEVRSSDAEAFGRAAARPDPRDPSVKIRPWREPPERIRSSAAHPAHRGRSAKGAKGEAGLSAAKRPRTAERGIARDREGGRGRRK